MAQKRVDVINKSGGPLFSAEKSSKVTDEILDKIGSASTAGLEARQKNIAASRSSLNQNIQQLKGVSNRLERAQSSKVGDVLKAIDASNPTVESNESTPHESRVNQLMEEFKDKKDDVTKSKDDYDRAVDAYRKYFPSQRKADVAIAKKPQPVYTDEDLMFQRDMLQIDKMSAQDKQDLLAVTQWKENNLSSLADANTPDVVWLPGLGLQSNSLSMKAAEATSRLKANGYTDQQIAELAETYARKLNADSAKQLEQGAAQLATESPLLANLTRLPVQLAAGTAGTLDYGIEYLQSLLDQSKRYSTLDPNLPGSSLGTIADSIYSTTRENIEQGKGGKLGGIAYGAATSLADNLLRFYASGGGILGKTGTQLMNLGMAGASAFSDTVRGASAKGATANQAALKGFSDAASEVLTEFIPLDNLLNLKASDVKTLSDVLKAALAQAGTEVATEEINFGIGLLTDALILGDKSDARLQLQQLMDSGMDKKEATKQVVGDLLRQAGTLAAETALSSFAQGGIEGGATAFQNRNHNTTDVPATQVERADLEQLSVPQSVPQAQKNTASGETVVTVKSAGPAINENTEKDNALAYQLASNIDNLRDMDSVSALTGKEFNNRGTKLSDQIRSFFKEIGNRVFRNGFGEVDLGEYGVGGVLNHRPINRAKVVSLAAVPDVIKNGKQIGYDQNWKGRGYESFIFAAPATVNGTPVYVAAVVDRRPNNKFYLSEMVDSEGNYVRIEESPSGNSKNGVTDGAGDSDKAGVTARPEELSEGSDPVTTATPTPLHSNIISNDQETVNTENASVGAADQNFTGLADYDQLLTDDNVQAPRASDAKHEEVPKVDAYGNKVSENATNVINSEIISERDVNNVKKMIADGLYGHQTQKMADVQEQVSKELEGKNLSVAVHQLTNRVAKGKISEYDIAQAQILLAHYTQKEGKAAESMAAELFVDLSQMATQSGRQLNMFKLFRKLTPQGQYMTVQKNVDRYVESINKGRSAKKQANVTIPKELQDQYIEAARKAARVDATESAQDALRQAEQDIYLYAASQIKSTFKEKWDDWRHMAMLGNLKTQIRNFGGSAMFKPFVTTKRVIGAALEKALSVPQDQRTKAVLGLGKDANLYRKLAIDDARTQQAKERMAFSARTGDAGKTGSTATDIINDNRTIFDYRADLDPSKFPHIVKKAWETVNKGLEASRKGLTDLMEGTDMIFKRWEYSTSLATFLKARGYSADQWQKGDVPAAVLEEARIYAAKEAMKATFNDQNVVSDAVSKLARAVDEIPVLNIAFEGVLPYKKTPANVAVRAVEYSPAELLVMLGKRVKNGKMSGAEFCDNLASTLTGTGAMVLGAALASGIFGIKLVGKLDDEDEERTGRQAYSLEIGDKSITIDWAAPSVIPLFVGSNIYNELTDGANDVSAVAKVFSSLATTFEPMLELSCLSSFADLVESGKYAKEGEALYAYATNIATSYFMQALPTIGSQFDQLGDKTRQMTYATSEDPVERSLQKLAAKATQRLPGDAYQTEYVDAWGRTDSTNWIESIFSPSYVSRINTTDADAEIKRLNDVQDENVSPSTPQYTITIDGKRRRLTGDEWTSLAKAQGQKAYELVSELIKSKEYKQMTDVEKAKSINSVYEYAREYARVSVLSDYTQYSAKWMEDISGKEVQTIMDRAIISASGLGSDARYSRAKEMGVELPQMQEVSEQVSQRLKGIENKTDYDTYRAVIEAAPDGEAAKWLEIYGMSETRLEEMADAQKSGISNELFVDYLQVDSGMDKAFKQITTAWKEGETPSLDSLSDAYDAFDALPPIAQKYFQNNVGGRLGAFVDAMDAGVPEKTFIDLWKQYYDMGNDDASASNDAARWAAILDKAKSGGKITQKQRDIMWEDLGYYTQLRQEAAKYYDLTGEGVSPDVAVQVSSMMSGLTKTAEKLDTIVNADLSEEDKKASVYAYLDDDQDKKFTSITNLGIDVDTYAALYGLYTGESGDGKKARVVDKYKREYGLSDYTAKMIYDIYAGKK